MAATVDESTPPDIATATVLCFSVTSVFDPIVMSVLLRRWLETNRGLLVHRTDLSQSPDDFRHKCHGKVYIFGRSLLAEAETNAAPRAIGRQPHRRQYVRGLNRPRRTRSSRRHCQTFEIESDDHRLALNVIEGNVGGVWHAFGAIAIHGDMLNLLQDRLLQTIAEFSHPANASVLESQSGDL